MDEITLKNYRCFREEQVARMAPLTLLVGENSTGKTSFLAMVRILWDIAAGMGMPDFKEPPYDLGSFEEIAHRRYGQSGRIETFEAGFSIYEQQGREIDSMLFDRPSRVAVTFGRKGAAPVPLGKHFSYGDISVDMQEKKDAGIIQVKTRNGKWTGSTSLPIFAENQIYPHHEIEELLTHGGGEKIDMDPVGTTTAKFDFDREKLSPELLVPLTVYFSNEPDLWKAPNYRRFASAPVRSKPQRTYDPTRIIHDPEGDYVPMYLADLYLRSSKNQWNRLKKLLEEFGGESGLFDEITVRTLGGVSDPFQIQIRKFGGKLKGIKHNFIDMGYGISQILPVITSLFRADGPRLFLMQQPEVHLHPRAQASLGSLLCEVAARGRQLVVETHSDHLLDRIRIDVRRGKTKLKPEDVSILYFERTGLDVTIHSIRIDEQGNIVGAPASYRQFFMEETAEDLGF